MPQVELIYGPPGTGKTTAMMERLEKEAKTVGRNYMAFISFTRAAAHEAESRLSAPIRWASTIHSMAFNLLNLTSSQVVDQGALRDFGNVVGFPITGYSPMVVEWADLQLGDRIMNLIDKVKSSTAKPEEWADRLKFEYGFSDQPAGLAEVEYVFKSYENWKESYGYFDFNDMIHYAISRELNPRVKVLFIDEGQDLSGLQWRWIEQICRGPDVERVYVAGDDDQSIYGWAGAVPTGMDDFGKIFDAKVTVLSQTWRYGRNIHTVAERLIKTIGHRQEKKYLPSKKPDQVSTMYDLTQSLGWGWNQSIAILFRNHSIRRTLEEDLRLGGIPYEHISGYPSPMTNKTARAIMAWHDCSWGVEPQEKDLKAMARVATSPLLRQAIVDGKTETMLRMGWRAAFEIPPELDMYYENMDWENIAPLIQIGTIHSAKGMEWDKVILINSMGAQTMENSVHNYDNECRVWYVGVTRAREYLDIIEEGHGFPIT